MNKILNYLIYKFINLKNLRAKVSYHVPFEEQLNYINKFDVEYSSDIDLSYFQFKSQRFLNKNNVVAFAEDFFSFWAIFLILPVFIINYRYISPKDISECKINFGIKQKMPKSLISSKNFESLTGCALNYDDFKFIIKIIFKYPFSFYFIFKNILLISIYRFNILKFPNATAFLVSKEYSFSSSVLTAYCKRNNILHINYMHGEKILNIRDSFFRFSKFYIWDKSYIKIFEILKASKNEFIIELPHYLSQFKIIQNDSFSKSRKMVYYLNGNENLSQVNLIINELNNFSKNKYKVFLKPHPAYFSNLKLIPEKYLIQNISLIDVDIVVSKYSTVLFESYILGKTVVIDNVSDIDLFQKLKKLKYIMLDKDVLYFNS